MRAKWPDDWDQNGMKSRLVAQQFNDDGPQNTPCNLWSLRVFCSARRHRWTRLAQKRGVWHYRIALSPCTAPIDEDIFVIRAERFGSRGIRMADSAGHQRHEEDELVIRWRCHRGCCDVRDPFEVVCTPMCIDCEGIDVVVIENGNECSRWRTRGGSASSSRVLAEQVQHRELGVSAA